MRDEYRRFACALTFVGALGACAAPQTQRIVAEATTSGRPASAELVDVPFFPQEQYFCGPSSLAMVLSWAGRPATPEDIASQVFTPGRQGSFAADMVSATRRNGHVAVELRTLQDVLGEIAGGHPVIVFQNLALSWFPRWHFAVAIGYDLEEQHLILRSGTRRRLVTPLDAFEHTWDRADNWALLVLPPDKSPATADAATWLRAIAALEGAGKPREALTAYRTYLARWPSDQGARMGEANALFALGDFAGAERVYRRVLASDQAAADAWNNLAHALHRQGKRAAAIEAARRAMSTAATGRDEYAATLREVTDSPAANP